MIKEAFATLIQVLSTTGTQIITSKITDDAREKAMEMTEKARMSSILKLAELNKGMGTKPKSELSGKKDATVGKIIREQAPALYESIAGQD